MKESKYASGKSRREGLHGVEPQGLQQGEVGPHSAIADGAGARNGKAAEGQATQASGARSLRPYQTLTEDNMAAALVEARGDLFVASQLLQIRATRLDRAIQVSAKLAAVVAGIRDAQGSEPYLKASSQDFARAIERRLALGRIVGMDSLIELASMPLDENSAQNQVRLAAAARLAGPPEGSQGGGELAEALRELNQAYQENAPRIRVTRERLTIETVPADERVVSSQEPLK
jgi:hypothetical protein